MVDVTLENADEDDQETFFTVKEVHATISGFNYQLSKNKTWFATWFAKPLLRAFIQVRKEGQDTADEDSAIFRPRSRHKLLNIFVLPTSGCMVFNNVLSPQQTRSRALPTS